MVAGEVCRGFFQELELHFLFPRFPLELAQPRTLIHGQRRLFAGMLTAVGGHPVTEGAFVNTELLRHAGNRTRGLDHHLHGFLLEFGREALLRSRQLLHLSRRPSYWMDCPEASGHPRGHRRGEGWRGVNDSEPLLMPRNHHILGRVAVQGDRGWPLRCGRRRPGTITGRAGTAAPRGTEGTRIQPGLTRAEHGKPVRVRAAGWRRGRPTVRGAEVPGRKGCPRSECRLPKGGRKARQHDRPLRRPSRITGRIPGLVPGRGSALTWAGEPVKTSSRKRWNQRAS